MTDITELIKVIAWPFTVLIILLVYRKKIPSLINGIAGRITRVEFAGLSLELAKAKSFNPDWAQAPSALDLRNKATSVQVNDSTAGTFMTQLIQDETADYAIINIGMGNEWLTSRLYIIAILYARMKGIKCFLFLDSNTDTAKRYVGWAYPDKIRWAFARKYPWLEIAFASAYSATIAAPGNNFAVVSDQGKLGNIYLGGQNPGIFLLSSFLGNIQLAPVPPAADQKGTGALAPEWTRIDSSTNTDEHGTWLSKILLESILGDDLHTTSLSSTDLRLKNSKEQLNLFLAVQERFVPVTDNSQRFEYLIDRQVLLEQLAVTSTN